MERSLSSRTPLPSANLDRSSMATTPMASTGLPGSQIASDRRQVTPRVRATAKSTGKAFERRAQPGGNLPLPLEKPSARDHSAVPGTNGSKGEGKAPRKSSGRQTSAAASTSTAWAVVAAALDAVMDATAGGRGCRITPRVSTHRGRGNASGTTPRVFVAHRPACVARGLRFCSCEWPCA